MKVDFCLIISAIGLIVLLPLGLIPGYEPYEGRCEETPTLYFQEELGDNPKQFAEFANSAQKTITIVARTLMPIGPDPVTWIEPLRNATNRGVKVEILTSIAMMEKYFNFTNFVLIDSLHNSYTSFAIADGERFIFTSQLFGMYKSPEADYYIDFKKCKSINRDAKAIIDFYKEFVVDPTLSLFPHHYCAGISYPEIHKSKDGSEFSFGISPPRFVSPGRISIIRMVQSFFSTAVANISVFTTSLFPEVNQTSNYMPELIMSDQIETTASSNNINVRILMSSDQYSAATNTTMSLSRVPNVVMAHGKFKETAPSFFLHDDDVIFMPMSFESAISLDVVSISLRIQNLDIALKVRNHFEQLWNADTTQIIS